MYDPTMGMPSITIYSDLLRHFNKVTPWRGSQDRPFGNRKYGNRRMRMLADRSIELEYMGHALIRWHPNGTISVRAYDCHRWGTFDHFVLPKQIRVDVGSRTGPII